MKTIRRINLIIAGIKLFKDWPLWILSRFHLLKKSGLGKFRLRNGTEFIIDFSHNNLGTFQEIWLMDVYQKNRRLKPSDIVVDIGASFGAFSVLAAKQGAKVYAYEPTPRSFELLVKNTEIYGVKAYNLAVAGKTGLAELFSSGGDEGNSLIPQLAPSQSFKVKTTTLNDILDQIGHCDFLKIDCEGGEIDILKNTLTKTFNQIDYIVLEYHRNLPEVLDLFKSKNYEVTFHGNDYGYLFAQKPKK